MTAVHDDLRRSAVGEPEVIDPRPMTGALIGAMVMLAVGFSLALWALTDSLAATRSIELPSLEVPEVESLDLGAARSELEELGFEVEVQFQPNEDPTKPKGVIIGQRPLAGSKIEQGELVVILASDGPLGQAVPAVEGQQVGDAIATLQATGLAAEPVPMPSETIRVDEVIATDPPSGARVPTAGAIKVLVSSGPAPRNVPPIMNKPVEQALADIGRAGLAPGKITRVFREDLEPGTVFEVDPPDGSAVPRDTPIALSVAGPEPTSTVPYMVGLLQESAQRVASGAGITLKIVTTPVSPGDALAGRVVSQGVPPQAEVKERSAVEITVAQVVEPVPAATTTAPPPGG